MKTLLPEWWQGTQRLLPPSLQPEWPLIEEFVAGSSRRLELFPGHNPRFPLADSLFLEPTGAHTLLSGRGATVLSHTELPLPYEDYSLDLIGGFGVLGSVTRPVELLRESLRLLQSGGRAVWGVPLGKWGDDSWDNSWQRVQRFTPDDIVTLFSETGFRVVRSATLPEQWWFRGWGSLVLPSLVKASPRLAHSLYHEYRGSRLYRRGPHRWNGIAENARWGLFLCEPERIA